MIDSEVEVGLFVQKVSGDYYFEGTIVSVFKKNSGKVRVVVENHGGILHIFNPSQIAKYDPKRLTEPGKF